MATRMKVKTIQIPTAHRKIRDPVDAVVGGGAGRRRGEVDLAVMLKAAKAQLAGAGGDGAGDAK